MNISNLETLYLVSPCYNDESTIAASMPIMLEKLRSLIEAEKVSAESKLLLIDDGSSDGTWNSLTALKNEYPDNVEILRHIKNLGEMQAYISGMTEAAKKADIIITIDSDLQDDINAVDKMIEKHNIGAEVVYGCRSDRTADKFLYRFCASIFYFLMKAFGSKVIPHSSNFRLMTKDAVKIFQNKESKGTFLPAEIPLLDLKSDRVYYERNERSAGQSGYNYVSLIKLALSAFKEYTFLFQFTAVSVLTLTFPLIYDLVKKNGKQ